MSTGDTSISVCLSASLETNNHVNRRRQIMDLLAHDAMILQDDPEDILSSSLQGLYDFRPVSFSTAGSIFTYAIKPGRISQPLKQIQVAMPDTDPSNWSLHASSIWVSSLFLADHLEELDIEAMAGIGVCADTGTGRAAVHVLELGAGAGLPSILLAIMYPHAVYVTASDYPDDRLIRTLSDNIRRNAVPEESCRAVPYAWGTDAGVLVHRSSGHGQGPQDEVRFDVVFASDTLWNPESHVPFVETLCARLRRDPEARVHLVAGLHTGRYTIQSFLDRASSQGLVLESAREREVGGTRSRPWDVSRAEGEDERERRKWVVWIILKWDDVGGASKPV